MLYVTFTHESGALTGAYMQDLLPEHESCHIEVTNDVLLNWCNYRANTDRDGVELLPPVTPAGPTEAEIVAGYMGAVQSFMDKTAVSFGYDNLLSVVSYASEPAVPRYQAEGQAFRAWRSQVWAYCEQVKADVDAGTRAQPTPEQLIAELPSLGIPSALTT